MAFEDLSRQGIVAYMEASRTPDTLWGFIHIPKTAGTSFKNELRRDAWPYYNIYVKNFGVSPEEWVRQEWFEINKFIDTDKAAPPGEKYKSFSGHLRRHHVVEMRRVLPHTRFFTILRDPV